MSEQEIKDKIDLKRKELSITPSEESKKRYRLQFQLKILQHQLEIERLQLQVKATR